MSELGFMCRDSDGCVHDLLDAILRHQHHLRHLPNLHTGHQTDLISLDIRKKIKDKWKETGLWIQFWNPDQDPDLR
jgi:hypothetical protein